MRTQVMHERAMDLPWLEQCPTEDGPLQRTVLDSFPFTIGRDESLSLPIPSKRVSRHHATILKTDDGYLLRDLDSTNGTFVNGCQVQEALLSDGDVLVFADLEFTFFAGNRQNPRDMATQVIQRGDADAPRPFAWEIVRTVRQLEETLVDRAMDVRLEPVVRLSDHQVVGLEARGHRGPDVPRQLAGEQSVYATDCRLTARLRQLRRRLAVEAARQLSDKADLFVHVDDMEIGDPGLAPSLGQLRQLLGETRRLVVVLPAGVFGGAGNVQEFCAKLRGSGLPLARAADAGQPLEGSSHNALWPDFLLLGPGIAQDLKRVPERQHPFQQMLRSCRQHHCEIIVTGLERPEEAHLCRQLGCVLGQGSLFADPPAPQVVAGQPECVASYFDYIASHQEYVPSPLERSAGCAAPLTPEIPRSAQDGLRSG